MGLKTLSLRGFSTSAWVPDLSLLAVILCVPLPSGFTPYEGKRIASTREVA